MFLTGRSRRRGLGHLLRHRYLRSRRTARGPEPYPAMAAVTERLVGRCAAPAQRHPRVLPDQRVVLTEDRDVAADEQRAVRALLYRNFLRHWLLRAAVQAAEVQRARGTALDHLADLAGRSVVHDDPRPALVVENSGESAQAFGGMDTERRLPGDLDLVVRVRTLDRRRVARLLAETLRGLIGLIVRWIARSFGHLLASMRGLHANSYGGQRRSAGSLPEPTFPGWSWPPGGAPPGEAAPDAVDLPGPQREREARGPDRAARRSHRLGRLL